MGVVVVIGFPDGVSTEIVSISVEAPPTRRTASLPIGHTPGEPSSSPCTEPASTKVWPPTAPPLRLTTPSAVTATDTTQSTPAIVPPATTVPPIGDAVGVATTVVTVSPVGAGPPGLLVVPVPLSAPEVGSDDGVVEASAVLVADRDVEPGELDDPSPPHELAIITAIPSANPIPRFDDQRIPPSHRCGRAPSSHAARMPPASRV
jgi:hypothetical protein